MRRDRAADGRQAPYQNFYDPKTLAVMDRAFAADLDGCEGGRPVLRDYTHDGGLRFVIGAKLLNLVAEVVIDPVLQRQLTVEELVSSMLMEGTSARSAAPSSPD